MSEEKQEFAYVRCGGICDVDQQVFSRATTVDGIPSVWLVRFEASPRAYVEYAKLGRNESTDELVFPSFAKFVSDVDNIFVSFPRDRLSDAAQVHHQSPASLAFTFAGAVCFRGGHFTFFGPDLRETASRNMPCWFFYDDLKDNGAVVRIVGKNAVHLAMKTVAAPFAAMYIRDDNLAAGVRSALTPEVRG
jgi:hypothetical protein